MTMPQGAPTPNFVALLSEIGRLSHAGSRKSGWWSHPDGSDKERNRAEMMMLMVSELAEMHRGVRSMAQDEHLPTRSSALVEAADFLIRVGDFVHGFGGDLGDEAAAVEIGHELGVVGAMCAVADAMEADRKGRVHEVNTHLARGVLIVAFFAAGFLGAPASTLIEVCREKLDYNQRRADHKMENRVKEGGKAY